MEQLDLISYALGGPGYKADGTSKEAAQRVSSTTEKARGDIRRLLMESRDPLSADEIAERLGLSVLYCRPRVSELHKMKAIRKVGRARNASGLAAWTWTVA
jgi:hypothetical protein